MRYIRQKRRATNFKPGLGDGERLCYNNIIQGIACFAIEFYTKTDMLFSHDLFISLIPQLQNFTIHLYSNNLFAYPATKKIQKKLLTLQ